MTMGMNKRPIVQHACLPRLLLGFGVLAAATAQGGHRLPQEAAKVGRSCV